MQVKKKRGRPKGSKNKKNINNVTERKTNKSITPIQLYETIDKENKITQRINVYFCKQFNQQTSAELCIVRASNKNLHYDFRITENKICNRCISDNKHIELKQLTIKGNKTIPDILKPLCENTIIETMITIENKTYMIEGI